MLDHLFLGAIGGAIFGLFLSRVNRKGFCSGVVCRMNGDPKVSIPWYAMIGAFLGATFRGD
ncbi:hypothetical protein LFE_1554 [Leptospirillum ferrooxidans C2-3]|jgi:hypothetical protein|uniref:Sulphur transport domain-containing protein n=1 Tax=Leptospirillum ferrooxidans (strain C2-3) TaxID=1162668 RepID=I0IPN7_LEPFC|nr:hypothetical protein LFE_1554 [Leptospirillum ferrooxidans C2-3]